MHTFHRKVLSQSGSEASRCEMTVLFIAPPRCPQKDLKFSWQAMSVQLNYFPWVLFFEAVRKGLLGCPVPCSVIIKLIFCLSRRKHEGWCVSPAACQAPHKGHRKHHCLADWLQANQMQESIKPSAYQQPPHGWVIFFLKRKREKLSLVHSLSLPFHLADLL